MRIGQQFIPHGIFIGSFIPNAILRLDYLNSNDKLVWARLAQFAGKDGRCYPKQSDLAKEIGVSDRTIRTSIQHLLEEGFIKVIKPQGKEKKDGLSDEYVFLWHECFNDFAGPERKNFPVQTGNDFRTKENNIIREENPSFNISPQRPARPTRPIKKSPTTFIEMFPKSYQSDESFCEAWSMFFEDRKKRVPLTENAVKLILTKFKNFPMDALIQGLNEAVVNGYRGVFVPKAYEGKTQTPLNKAAAQDQPKRTRPLRNHGLCYNPDDVPTLSEKDLLW